jgi:hypothetical protein
MMCSLLEAYRLSFKSMANFYKFTLAHIPEDVGLHSDRRESLKSIDDHLSMSHSALLTISN